VIAEVAVTTSFFLEAEKTRKQAYKKQLANQSAALEREHVIAARESAKAAKMAAWAALAAAVGAIAQVIVAIVK
jgi:hypothetical protein